MPGSRRRIAKERRAAQQRTLEDEVRLNTERLALMETQRLEKAVAVVQHGLYGGTPIRAVAKEVLDSNRTY